MTGVQQVGAIGLVVCGLYLAGIAVWCWGFRDGRREGLRDGAEQAHHAPLRLRPSPRHLPHDWPPSHGHPHGRI